MAGAPGEQRVVDEYLALQQHLVIGLDVQPAQTDRGQPRAERVAVEVGGDVGGVHELRQPGQRRVTAQVVFGDQGLERAPFAGAVRSRTVVELGPGRVEGVPAGGFGGAQHVTGGDVDDLGVAVDAVTTEASTSRDSDAATRRRVAARRRRELHRIEARDFFEPAQRDPAVRAVDKRAAQLSDQALT
jgi:hypothetical protein